MKQIARDLPHYMLLFGILLAGFAGMVIFSYNKNFQAASALAMASSYVSWGVVHHLIHKDFQVEIFIEYLAVALLGLAIIFSLVIRA